MRKLIIIIFTMAIVSCSDDCKSEKAEMKASYDAILENDQMTSDHRAEITRERDRKLKEFDC